MKTFFFTYRSNYIDLYLRFSTNELGWWAVANCPELSPIFSVSLRELPRALRKKGNKTKTRNKNRHRAEDKENIGWVSSFFHRTYSQTDKGKHVLISELISAPGTITSGKSAVYMSRSDNDMYVFLRSFKVTKIRIAAQRSLSVNHLLGKIFLKMSFFSRVLIQIDT